jgi:hypothetical protein
MALISEDQWDSLFEEPIRQLGAEDEPPFDFWPYVEAIPPEDFQGYDCSEGRVDYAYRHPAGRLEHVLINSDNKDVFMVIVLDPANKTVIGHRLLDLPDLYGLNAGE